MPEPQVGSNTRSPGSVVIRRQRSMTFVLSARRRSSVPRSLRCPCRPRRSSSGKTGKSSMEANVSERDPDGLQAVAAASRPCQLIRLPTKLRSGRLPVLRIRPASEGVFVRTQSAVRLSIRKTRAPSRESSPPVALRRASSVDAFRPELQPANMAAARAAELLRRDTSAGISRLAVTCVPQDVVVVRGEQFARRIRPSCLKRDQRNEVLAAEDLVEERLGRGDVSSPIWTKIEPDSLSRSRATASRSRR